MDVALIMFRPDGSRRALPITKPQTVIGRREDCDLRIPLANVSRQHCKLVIENGIVRVEDMGSANGTLCNGTRVELQALKAGDTLIVGSVKFVVQIDGEPAEDAIGKKPQKAAGSIEDDIDAILAGDDNDDSASDFKVDLGDEKT